MVVVTSFEETNNKVNTAFRKEIEGPVECLEMSVLLFD